MTWSQLTFLSSPARNMARLQSEIFCIWRRALTENYDGNNDLSRLVADLARKRAVDNVSQFNTRTAAPGARFYYASVETLVLGLVLRAAIRKPITDYLREKIWQPIGAEANASWEIDISGQEVTFCCFNAVLRDYARTLDDSSRMTGCGEDANSSLGTSFSSAAMRKIGLNGCLDLQRTWSVSRSTSLRHTELSHRFRPSRPVRPFRSS